MSAFANSPAAPQPASPGTPPKPVAPPAPATPSHRKWWVLAVLVVAVGGAAAWALRPRPAVKNTIGTSTIRTVKVVSGGLTQALRLTGSTTARSFFNVVAPMMRGPDAGRAQVLIFLAKSGTFVKKGDVIAQIDAQSIKDHVDDVEATVISSLADIRKRQAEHAIELESLNQNLRVAKATLDKARLDQGASEIRTPIDQELLKLSVEQAAATHLQLQQDLVTTQTRQKSELRLLELAKERNERHRDRHKTDVTRFTMTSPMNGLVVMQSVWRGGDMGQIQQGDQISPGQPFAKIVDTSSMQLEAFVNQTESEAIRIGQRATVTFDAFPGLVLKGKVDAVGALAIGGWRQNYYIRNVPVRVAIEGQDPRVIPDLSAAADVVLSEKEGGVVVPREALSEANGKTVVYVKQADSFAPRPVEVGDTNNTQVAVTSGLRPGDEIAVQALAVLNR